MPGWKKCLPWILVNRRNNASPEASTQCLHHWTQLCCISSLSFLYLSLHVRDHVGKKRQSRAAGLLGDAEDKQDFQVSLALLVPLQWMILPTCFLTLQFRNFLIKSWLEKVREDWEKRGRCQRSMRWWYRMRDVLAQTADKRQARGEMPSYCFSSCPPVTGQPAHKPCWTVRGFQLEDQGQIQLWQVSLRNIWTWVAATNRVRKQWIQI